ncbi:hypothetical protein K438DRAFT_1589979 [Mycena galopus ATCC 62051]|nr:hypothetical protein K438DRAFT_1589979 [Mycena galopus ATCC 62051]
MYAPGFNETPLVYGAGGSALYAHYLAQILELLSCPHTIGFLYRGGIESYVAQIYDSSLVDRLRQGPSHQVRSFGRGEIFYQVENGRRVFYVADEVSDSEIRRLCGHISTGHPTTDTFLWPLPTWIEEDCLHWHGAWTSGFWKFLEDTCISIIERKRYTWRTEREWRGRLENGNKGAFKTSGVSAEDFEEGRALAESAFPVSWNKKPLLDISLPEKWESSPARD